MVKKMLLVIILFVTISYSKDKINYDSLYHYACSIADTCTENRLVNSQRIFIQIMEKGLGILPSFYDTCSLDSTSEYHYDQGPSVTTTVRTCGNTTYYNSKISLTNIGYHISSRDSSAQKYILKFYRKK